MIALLASCSPSAFKNQLPYALVSRQVEMWQLFPELLTFSSVCRFSGKKKKRQKTACRAGTCFLLMACFTPDLFLFSVIQECCYISENKQPCSVEALTKNISFSWQLCLESAFPSAAAPQLQQSAFSPTRLT